MEGKIANMVTFIHKTPNIPTKATLVKEIENRQLANLPMMTKTNVTKYLQNWRKLSLETSIKKVITKIQQNKNKRKLKN